MPEYRLQEKKCQAPAYGAPPDMLLLLFLENGGILALIRILEDL
jgi:hypothetical protein